MKIRAEKKYILVGVAVLAVGILIFVNGYRSSTEYKVDRQLALGEKYLDEMNYEQAVAAYMAVLEIDPNNEEVKNAVAACIDIMYEAADEMAVQGDYEGASELAGYILQLEHDNIWGSLIRADVAYHMGEIQEAAVLYRKVLEKDSENSKASEGVEKCEVKKGEVEEGEAVIDDEGMTSETVFQEQTSDEREEVPDDSTSYKEEAVDVEFKRYEKYDSYEGDEYGIFSGISDDGNVVWTYETEHCGLTELAQVADIGLHNGIYYLNEAGKIVTLNPKTGDVLWENSGFGGGGISYTFDDNGILYASGFYGPILCVIDKNGKTIDRHETFIENEAEYYWPYKLEYEDGFIFISCDGVTDEALWSQDLKLVYDIKNKTINSLVEKPDPMTVEEAYRLLEEYRLSTSGYMAENVIYEGDDEYGYCFWGYIDVDDGNGEGHSATIFRIAVNPFSGRLYDMNQCEYLN